MNLTNITSKTKLIIVAAVAFIFVSLVIIAGVLITNQNSAENTGAAALATNYKCTSLAGSLATTNFQVLQGGQTISTKLTVSNCLDKGLQNKALSISVLNAGNVQVGTLNVAGAPTVLTNNSCSFTFTGTIPANIGDYKLKTNGLTDTPVTSVLPGCCGELNCVGGQRINIANIPNVGSNKVVCSTVATNYCASRGGVKAIITNNLSAACIAALNPCDMQIKVTTAQPSTCADAKDNNNNGAVDCNLSNSDLSCFNITNSAVTCTPSNMEKDLDASVNIITNTTQIVAVSIDTTSTAAIKPLTFKAALRSVTAFKPENESTCKLVSQEQEVRRYNCSGAINFLGTEIRYRTVQSLANAPAGSTYNLIQQNFDKEFAWYGSGAVPANPTSGCTKLSVITNYYLDTNKPKQEITQYYCPNLPQPGGATGGTCNDGIDNNNDQVTDCTGATADLSCFNITDSAISCVKTNTEYSLSSAANVIVNANSIITTNYANQTAKVFTISSLANTTFRPENEATCSLLGTAGMVKKYNCTGNLTLVGTEVRYRVNTVFASAPNAFTYNLVQKNSAPEFTWYGTGAVPANPTNGCTKLYTTSNAFIDTNKPKEESTFYFCPSLPQPNQSG